MAAGSWLSARINPSSDVMGWDSRAASISWSAPDNSNMELIWAGARGDETDDVGTVEEAGGERPDIVLYRTV